MDKACDITKQVLHVEVLLLPSCALSFLKAEYKVKEYIETCHASSEVQKTLVLDDFRDTPLQDIAESIHISGTEDVTQVMKRITICDADLQIHVYQLVKDGPGTECCDGGDGDSELSSASHWILPCADFHGLWDSLIYDMSIKAELLNYVTSMLLFSDKEVNNALISWNRVVLLHGPPGTGKTSLCRALAQKLTIRLGHRYQHGQLIEINSHSLFSKWFSESGKLVMKLFHNIRKIVENCNALVIVLIDEVESLTHARKLAMAGSEPSDSIRAVNAVLTQIDIIRRYPNVLILTTSNITEAIDLAFVDRADIKQYIGLPSVPAVYNILHSCIYELIRAKLIKPDCELLSYKDLEIMKFVHVESSSTSLRLLDIAKVSVGLSGRSLRKIPLIAHALYIQGPGYLVADTEERIFLSSIKLPSVVKRFGPYALNDWSDNGSKDNVLLDVYLDAIMQTIIKEFKDQTVLREKHNTKLCEKCHISSKNLENGNIKT